MKKLKSRGMVSLCAMMMLVCLIPMTANGNFSFSRPETMLVEASQESTIQWGVDIDFDNAGALHSVWVDTRMGTADPSIWGTYMLPSGHVQMPYAGYHQLGTENYDAPFISQSDFDSSRMYVFGVMDDGTGISGVVSDWDLTQLPGEPGVSNISSIALTTTILPNRTAVDMVACGDYLIYAYEYYPNIYLRRYDIPGDVWDTAEQVISLTDHEFTNPRLAVDDDNFVYLSYDKYNTSSFQYNLIARRTAFPAEISNFYNEVRLLSLDAGEFNADMAISGPSGAPNCAFVYIDPNGTSGEMNCNMDVYSDWISDMWSSPNVFTFAFRPSSAVAGPNAAYDADGQTLYVAWADNSQGDDEVFGAVSLDGGLTFLSDQQLTTNAMPVLEAPVVATGPEPGTYAIAYIRNSGASTTPFALVSMPAFFDRCDIDPGTTGYWSSYSGVSVVTSGFPTPYSPPGCYRMATAKGQLLNEYGTVEQQGGVDLQFYDTMSTSVVNNFYVALENNNAKGVIRMLGVRNDTTSTNYSYSFDGVNWTDTTIPRSNGWHNLVMTANDTDGLTMYIDNIGSAITDPTFQTFTRIIIDGGLDSDPYFVDDIVVHAIPELDERVIPASSPLSLTILLLAIGWISIRRYRR